jgi:hypothetical protein
MTIGRTRTILTTAFVACLAIGLAIVLIAYAKGLISSGELGSLLTVLLGAYSVHLGVILGGVYGDDKPRGGFAAGLTGQIAVAVALLWNLILLGLLLIYAMAVFDPGHDDPSTTKDLIANLQLAATASSFLVAGALAFFFARSASR